MNTPPSSLSSTLKLCATNALFSAICGSLPALNQECFSPDLRGWKKMMQLSLGLKADLEPLAQGSPCDKGVPACLFREGLGPDRPAVQPAMSRFASEGS